VSGADGHKAKSCMSVTPKLFWLYDLGLSESQICESLFTNAHNNNTSLSMTAPRIKDDRGL
jgi:hypothetical protein